MADDRIIAALLRERAALAQQGKTDRVEQVDEQLKAYGHEPAEEPKKPAGDPKRQAPQGRAAKPQQTAD